MSRSGRSGNSEDRERLLTTGGPFLLAGPADSSGSASEIGVLGALGSPSGALGVLDSPLGRIVVLGVLDSPLGRIGVLGALDSPSGALGAASHLAFFHTRLSLHEPPSRPTLSP